ncbi:ArdC-like ssDNA-binding domain-containing protein [Micropruina sonneratiae]|uniref:ArdC-like ssDNA-binding domain-containing protein n=1 Tax=Micropruina sonneratiae TaxID=2986940 RepID=UPI0022277757|nr:ArdC-like ssDNA-binding domain-containing protein [Micropruina sp. KQZ13P-5]MCW3158794.1 ArdC-like ssDNA-binding domain-containing protein [Micropruina sp. KQZ13P-5]
MLEEATTMPGQMSAIYSRFYRYSLENQVLLFMQGVREPVNTYQCWLDSGRQVKKGSKAQYILRPMFRKERDEDTGEETQRVVGFKPINCLFGASETDGDELPGYEPPEWSATTALGALGITRVAFEMTDGNTAHHNRGCRRGVIVVGASVLG